MNQSVDIEQNHILEHSQPTCNLVNTLIYAILHCLLPINVFIMLMNIFIHNMTPIKVASMFATPIMATILILIFLTRIAPKLNTSTTYSSSEVNFRGSNTQINMHDIFICALFAGLIFISSHIAFVSFCVTDSCWNNNSLYILNLFYIFSAYLLILILIILGIIGLYKGLTLRNDGQ
jgi:hypothetical protein